MFNLAIPIVVILTMVATQEVEVIKSSSVHIGNAVLDCQEEMGFDDSVIQRFHKFWNPEFMLSDIHLGCAISCVVKKLDLMEANGEIKAENWFAFTEANGAGVKMSHQIVKLAEMCKDIAFNSNKFSDSCSMALEFARCCRYGITQLRWAPNAKNWGGEQEDPDPIEMSYNY